MGACIDTIAVVDSSNDVYGTYHLRVVDASTLSFMPPGHPQPTLYALGEKVGKAILQQDRVPLSTSSVMFPNL